MGARVRGCCYLVFDVKLRPVVIAGGNCRASDRVRRRSPQSTLRIARSRWAAATEDAAYFIRQAQAVFFRTTRSTSQLSTCNNEST